jgi:hypothetical protein
MQAGTVFFILYLLTGEASMTPVAQYQSKESCIVVETVMNAAVGEASVENAKFKCIDAQTLMEMMGKNGIDVH